MSEKITIEKLAEVSQNEFTAIRSEMKDGFAAVDARFNALEKNIEYRFDALAEILKDIRSDIKEIKADVVTVNLDYTELRTRVERLEKKTGIIK